MKTAWKIGGALFPLFAAACGTDTGLGPTPDTGQTPGDNLAGVYEITALDATGDLIATGRLFIEKNLDLSNDPARPYVGTWSFVLNDLDEPHGFESGSGELAGSLGETGDFGVNLNPGWVDNNLSLVWRASGEDSTQGVWRWVTFSGLNDEGTFTVTKVGG